MQYYAAGLFSRIAPVGLCLDYTNIAIFKSLNSVGVIHSAILAMIQTGKALLLFPMHLSCLTTSASTKKKRQMKPWVYHGILTTALNISQLHTATDFKMKKASFIKLSTCS